MNTLSLPVGHLPLTLIGFVGLILCSSCATQTKTTTLPVDPPDSFSNSGDRQLPVEWWTVFENEELDTAVDTALAANFDLQTAWQRLQAARAVVDRESSALFPDLEATAQAGISRSLSEFQEGEDIRVGLSSAYEIDLWGRIQAGIEAEEFRAYATFNDFNAAALSISAEVVRVWYQVAEARNQIQLIEDQIETNQKVLDLLESRFGSGQIRGVDILRQRQLLEATREQQTYAESNLRVLEHQLAVLLGHSPQQNIDYTPDTLPELPPLPETGVPTDLIRRRPDVQRAFNELRAADRDLAAAISNQYPRLSLSASVSSAANNAGNLFEEWAFSFAGNIIAPILYGGELRAEVDRVEAITQQRLFEYGQTILTAFQEVENALIREEKQKESIESLENQVELAEKAYEQLQVQYLNGSSNYLDVLTALGEVQQLRRDLITERLNLVDFRISLYRALAGPIDTASEQEAEQQAESLE